ncbi:TBC1 domain family member 31 [Asbolus verrucosus]|uniref:TBC1 domain family member 31 n=1 Tax=Asbolus verrucosus TaxID=1661398 RepID=A0A482WBE9_ASBVE|nr:TBC1 domain family member 31 [Asbolus verrucosus]
MTLNLTKEKRIYKKLFHLKPPQRDGLILNVHHTKKDAQKTRFINSCFNKYGQILVLADNEGNIFVIDFDTNKFWNIPKVVDSCTVIKFSNFKENEVLTGAKDGRVHIIDIQTGLIAGNLKGHKHPVTAVSYAYDFICVTSSVCEAIVWDMKTNTKAQVLNLDPNCTLKCVAFMPVTSNILTCFNDDVIQIWQFGTFEIKTQIPPVVWYNHEVRSITFTADGKTMVLGCRSPYLALFLLSNFKLLKFITLPEYVQTIKHIDFIPQMNDGGANKILAILSGRGSIYFYDIEQNVIISELVPTYEISKYDCSPKSSYIACVLCSGDTNVYDVTQYIVVPIKLKPVRAEMRGRSVKFKKCLEKMGVVKEQIREILEIEKMRMILRECGQYPDTYRTKIWEHLLELPNNKDQYNAIINNRMIISFEDLCKKYPLEDKRSLKNLKQLLDNLVTWCPFFLHVDYLPVFVFPFVKVFHNKPLTCFEAVCTIIVNWCQFWFEYFPLPPVNVLAMVENVLMERDPELLHFLAKNKVQSKLYAWPILRTAFSEILTAPAWKVFWDHVITNEPSFLLCGVVAYNILQRTALLSLKNEKHFKCFYYTHHPIDVKKLLHKTYQILNETSETIHPRRYLNMFKKIIPGEYPNFCDYPKTIINLKSEKSEALKKELKKLKTDEIDLFRKRLASLDKLQQLEILEEENKRVLEMENAVKKQLLEEQERVHNFYERMAQLRQKFREEDKVLGSLRNKIARGQQIKNRERYLSSLCDDVKLNRREKDYAMTKVEDELLYHYSELLRNKHKIEKLLGEEEVLFSTKTSTEPSSIFLKQQQELSDEISLLKRTNKSQEDLKLLNLATGIAAMDALIKKIEIELDRERRGEVNERTADKKVLELQAETKDLVTEVNKLLHLLAEMRNVELGG